MLCTVSKNFIPSSMHQQHLIGAPVERGDLGKKKMFRKKGKRSTDA